MKKLITILFILINAGAYSQAKIPATNVIQDPNRRFVTDLDKAYWNNKQKKFFLTTTTAPTSWNGEVLNIQRPLMGGGQLSYVFAAPLFNINGSISMPAASLNSNGYMSAVDFNAFSRKMDSASVMKLITANMGVTNGGTAVVLNPPFFYLDGALSMPEASATSGGYISAAKFIELSKKLDSVTVKNMISEAIAALPKGGGGIVTDSFSLPIGPGLQFKNGILDIKR